MARLLKCYGTCNKKYPKEEMQVFSGKNHCPSCYEDKKREDQERIKLNQTISKWFNISFPNGHMLKQIKNFRSEPYNYSYKNIRFTIDYCFSNKKVKPEIKFGIAFVPHYHDEMIDYYKEFNRKRAQTVVQEEKIIRLKLKPFKLENKYKDKKFINMEELLK
jgi:hypothetical protein